MDADTAAGAASRRPHARSGHWRKAGDLLVDEELVPRGPGGFAAFDRIIGVTQPMRPDPGVPSGPHHRAVAVRARDARDDSGGRDGNGFRERAIAAVLRVLRHTSTRALLALM